MADMVHKIDNDLITIRGLIVPVDWDEKGNVTGIAVSTFDEEEYVIERDKKGEMLLPLLRKEVEVSGIVRRKDRKKRIKVKNFSRRKRIRR